MPAQSRHAVRVEALIALHKPGTAGISDAEEYVFHLMSGAAADRDTALWSFYAAGIGGCRFRLMH